MIMKIVSWTGSTLLSICGAPLAIESYRDKSSSRVSWSFLLMWGSGEALTLVYITALQIKSPSGFNLIPLLLNYGCNILFIGVIVYYKLFDKWRWNL